MPWPKNEAIRQSIEQENNNGSRKLSDTASKQSRTRGLIPFKKGDPRINRKGRPRNFDEVRAIAQSIAHETESNRKTAIENVLREWRDSPEPTLQKAFVEYGFGKVPDKIETTGLENKTTLILHWPHERPDLIPSHESNGR